MSEVKRHYEITFVLDIIVIEVTINFAKLNMP